MRAFFSTDGEPIILYQSCSDEIQAEFKSQCIDYVKGGASTTSIHNALDRTVVFRDMRKGIKKVSETGIPNIHTTLEQNIDDTLNRFEREIIVGGIGTEYKKAIKFGLTIIIHCMQDEYCTPCKLIHGFVCCGQHVFPERDIVYSENGTPSTISFDKIMRQCESELTQDELANMKRHAPELIQILLDKGEITEKEYDDRNIPQLPEEDFEIRNDLVLCRQRCVIITHDETVARYKEYAQRKADLGDPNIRKAIAVAKKAEKRKRAEADKETAKERIQAMAPKEKVAYDLEKKKIVADKKALKEINKGKQLEAESNAYELLRGKEHLYRIPEETKTESDEDMDVND